MERDAPRTPAKEAVGGNLNVKGSVTITGEDLNRRFADVLEAIAANHSAVLARFDRIEARFDHLDARSDRIEARFDHLESRFDHLEGKLDQLLNR